MTHERFNPGDRVVVTGVEDEPFESVVLAQWGRIVSLREPGTTNSEVQVYARFVEAVPDYEVNADELRRLARLSKEYADSDVSPNSSHYADGVRDVLLYLAGEKADTRLVSVLELNPELKPRLA
jgi:hypothetical protein